MFGQGMRVPGCALRVAAIVGACLLAWATAATELPPTEAEIIDDVLAGSGWNPLLTVGDSAGFCRQGGAIGFFLEDGKVRFEINVAAAERRGLRVSSSLLRLARIIKDETRP